MLINPELIDRIGSRDELQRPSSFIVTRVFHTIDDLCRLESVFDSCSDDCNGSTSSDIWRRTQLFHRTFDGLQFIGWDVKVVPVVVAVDSTSGTPLRLIGLPPISVMRSMGFVTNTCTIGKQILVFNNYVLYDCVRRHVHRTAYCSRRLSFRQFLKDCVVYSTTLLGSSRTYSIYV